MRYVQYRTVCAWRGHAMARMAMDAISETTHHWVRQGPRQARGGRRRLIQLAQTGDHLWSLCPAPYAVQTHTQICRLGTWYRFFFLNSHVTRWDRIEPILICSPRIPAPRGRNRETHCAKSCPSQSCLTTWLPWFPGSPRLEGRRVRSSPSYRALEAMATLQIQETTFLVACIMCKQQAGQNTAHHITAQIRSDQIRSG